MARGRRRSRRAKILTVAATAALVMTIAGTIGIIGAFAYFSRDLPSPDKLTNREVAQSTKIYDRNGTLLYDIYDGEHDRTLLKLKDVPQSVKDATIAAEDANFYEHQGFDLKGIVVALFKDLTSHSIEGGGSTITQQLVKNVILQDTRQTPIRKIKELILAIQIERKFSKDDILQIYLNEMPYGGTAYGIEAAAHHYFGKSAKELTLPESALLAGMLQSPTRYNPLVNPDAAYARQHYVLDQMVRKNKISQKQEEEALKAKLNFTNGVATNIKAPHFVMYVRQLLEEQYGTKLVEKGGLRVTTTLDYDKQKIAEEEVQKQIEALAKAKANASNAGLIAADPRTGEILSYVGSEDFNDTEHQGNVDAIQSLRQPGSSIKPITYLTAFTKGYTLGTYLGDVPTCFGGDPNWCPANSTNSFWGPLQPRVALSNSRNIPAIKMLAMVGSNNMLDMAHKLGITTMNDPKTYGLALALGAAEAKPYDMAQVYATLANQGVQQPLTAILKVQDASGKVLDEYKPGDGKKVVDPKYVYLVTDIISDNAARQRLFGAHNKLEIGRPAAVKTGTTDDNKDAWTAGYTPSLSTVVWVGNMDATAMRGIQGSTGATPIWNGYMKRVLAGTPVEQFKQPSGIVKVTIDAISGMLPGPYSKTKTELFVKGTEPTQVDTFSKQVKVDKDNGLLANPATIATGNAKDEVCTQLEEPVAAWQAATNDWMSKQGAPWGCPTETSKLYHTAGDLPTVKITSPTNGATVGTSFKVTADVASAGTVTKVTFLLDDVPVNVSTTIPYQYTYSLPHSDTGPHTITVKAQDSNGNEGTGSITVKVGGAGGVGDDPTPVANWPDMPDFPVIPTIDPRNRWP
jgi:1A family penicillin-binding protein